MVAPSSDSDKDSIITVIEKYRADFISLESRDFSKEERSALLNVHRELLRIKALVLDKRATRSLPNDARDNAIIITSSPSQGSEASDQYQPESPNLSSIRNEVASAISQVNNNVFNPLRIFISRKTGKIIQLNPSKKRKFDGFMTVDDIERDCVTCDETFLFDEVIKVPCGHYYCQSCVKELVDASLKDETLFKPKCCKEDMPLALIWNILSTTQREGYKLRELEMDSKDRTYCVNSACTIFINPQLIFGGVATCGKCNTRTCALCKTKAHDGDCPKDEAIKQTEELANKEGWKRCPVCKRFIELKSGCNHIACLCGKHWCFVCVRPWKTCACPSWTQDNLRARAEEIVARNHPRPPPVLYGDAPVRPQPVHQPPVPPPSVNRPPVHRPPVRQPQAPPPPPPPAPAPVRPQPTPKLPQRVQVHYQPMPIPPAPAPTHRYSPPPYQRQPYPEAERRYQLQVQQEMAYLEQNHECDHQAWKWVRGRHRCENCHWRAPLYIFQCRQCRLRACNRCRRNRIMV